MTRAGTAVAEKAGAGAEALVASPRLSLALFWLSAGFTGGGDGTACLAFLEFITLSPWLWVDRSMTPPGRGS